MQEIQKSMSNKEPISSGKWWLFMIAAMLTSCFDPIDPYSAYCGAQVVAKWEGPLTCRVKFRHEGKITGPVDLVQMDYDSFNVGDTVKCDEQ